MDSIAKDILNDLLQLVKYANPENFLKASKSKGISVHLKSAMENLALECLEKSSNLKGSSVIKRKDRIVQISSKKNIDILYSKTKAISKIEADQIYDILLSSKRFANKAAIMQFANYIGLPLNINKKDSRARSAKIIAIAIASSPERIKRKSHAILNEMLDDQTQGWFDIITK